MTFNSKSGNCDPLFAQKKCDNTHFGKFCPGGGLHAGLCPGVFVLGLCSGGLFPRTRNDSRGKVVRIHYREQGFLLG